ncbi:MAG: UDP-N-acetylmuramoyl-tripeptide--D-alanyl-D-alanine ligase, partial [Betaproteobacteria bacterium]|nr:UDP-N-acetylmuramoyl-tripeptide--D-alanyl-D-alanine ligase [Betaproteobacteria bacterium]
SILGFALEGGAGARQAEVLGGYTLKQLLSEVRLRTPAGTATATLGIPGLHNVRNALAAAACAHAAGIPPATIRTGLEDFRPYVGRLQVKRAPSGVTVIDDSYNANPDSVRAAIDVLAACRPPTVLVLGDMGEVGDRGPEFHREVGRYARCKGVTVLLAIGEATRDTVEAFGATGSHASSIDDLIELTRTRAAPRATLLIKGSRFMRMERVVAALLGATVQGEH